MAGKALLYTAPGCPFCLMVKAFLQKNGVNVWEADISKDSAAKAEMEKKSGQSNVPVTEIKGKIIIGYDLQKLKEAVK